MKRPFTLLTVLFLALIAIAHLLRLVLGWQVMLNATVVPMWVSVAGLLIAGGLALSLWWESRK
jgi:hypothetical protein